MKMLKKMAALLLAGVMALALLTACGDEAPSKSFAQQVEETAFEAMKQSTGIQVNDADLKKLAESKIDQINMEDGTFNFKNALDMQALMEEIKELKDMHAEINVKAAMPFPESVVTTDKPYKVLEVTPENIGDVAKIVAKMGKLNSIENDGLKVNKLGIVAKTVNGKTYVAVAMDVTTSVEEILSMLGVG
ncbi:hypothetical protein [Faecalibacterium prausnitzii]|uniref:hypothetical protein n=1 Tax=Faecalibacterium prausnitzii TaxID=853 RepID=UPI0012DCF336|nr:hypothetical protein [Faecalibacterium prausnitzii]